MTNVERLRSEVELILNEVPIDFGGGCSVSKATVLAYIIRSQRITRSIDIGIYRGRSFFPQGVAHKTTGGKVLGIDPYSRLEAMEHDHAGLRDQIAAFVNTTDFDQLFETADRQRADFGLIAQTQILRKTSAAAAEELLERGETFGLIHIDGNHDTSAVLADVEAYSKLLYPKNGFLVLDDISWTSVKPAVDRVSDGFTLLYARVDTKNDYAVFWNGSSRAKKSRLRTQIAIAAEN